MLAPRLCRVIMPAVLLWLSGAGAGQQYVAFGAAPAQLPMFTRPEARRVCPAPAEVNSGLRAPHTIVTDHQDRWPLLVFPLMAGAAGVYIAVLIRRRRRARKPDRLESAKGVVEKFSGVVALCTGLFVLLAQFFPGLGVTHHPPPSATMAVRYVAPLVPAGFERPGLALRERLELGDLILLELHLAGYGGQNFSLQWGAAEPGYDGVNIPGTAREADLKIPRHADAATMFLPLWVNLSTRPFQVHFFLTDGHGGMLQVTSTEVLRGLRAPFLCARRR